MSELPLRPKPIPSVQKTDLSNHKNYRIEPIQYNQNTIQHSSLPFYRKVVPPDPIFMEWNVYSQTLRITQSLKTIEC